MLKTHDCFDNERFSHKDAGFHVYECTKCGRESWYIAPNPYPKNAKFTPNKVLGNNSKTMTSGTEGGTI